MDRKFKEPRPSRSIVFIGDNFINQYIFENFKRYSNIKPALSNNIKELKHRYDFIMDCTFNQKSQDDTINYAVENKLLKVIIVNHWKRDIKNYDNLAIIQVIVPDVYGTEHMSFKRPGSGNNYDTDINYCTLICESIRRIHDSKSNMQPITYIYYGTDKIKYIYVENLYEPLNYVVNEIESNCYFEIYDEEKSVGEVLTTIKDTLEYTGQVIFENTDSIFNKPVKRIDYRHNYRPLKNMVKTIYDYLLYNNERFNLT